MRWWFIRLGRGGVGCLFSETLNLGRGAFVLSALVDHPFGKREVDFWNI